MNIYNPPSLAAILAANGTAEAVFGGTITAKGDINFWGGNASQCGGFTANSAGGGIYGYAVGTNQNIKLVPSGSGITQVQGAAGIAASIARLDALRVDQAAAVGTIIADHTAVFNLNGTDYKFGCVAA